jgi:AMP deaminase
VTCFFDLMNVQTNVPDIRLAYRHRTLVQELAMIRARNAVQTSESHPAVLPTSDAVAARAMAKYV